MADLLSQTASGIVESWQGKVLLVILLTAFTLICWYLVAWRSSSDSANYPPGKLGLPILGENIAFLYSFYRPLGIYDFVLNRYKRYGKIFKTSILGSTTVFVTGREAGKFITSNEHKIFNLAPVKSMEDVIGPQSIFQARGDLHKKMRRLAGDPLSIDSLKKHLREIEDIALHVLNRWQGRNVCVLDEATDFAFQIISYILISSQRGPEQDKLRDYFQHVTKALVALPFKVPGLAYYDGIKARNSMCVIFDEVIARRRGGVEYHDDFVQSVLVKDGSSEDKKISDAQLKDNLIAVLMAGHETSAAALMWAMKFLEDNPNVEEKLVDEHKEIKMRKAPGEHLTWEDVNRMHYTNKFITETLRKANIAGLLPRVVLQDVEISGYLIKKGWRVVLDTQSIHFDSSVFDTPDLFDPSRFDEQPKPYSFMAFGGGARTCLGMNLARIEMAVFLHHLVTKYRWRGSSKDTALVPTLIPKLKSGYPITVYSCD